MNYYQTLGLEKNATEMDIKNAYKKLALKNHPDRGGDEETFKKISEAYEVLSDKEKRMQYDNNGKISGITIDSNEIFRHFFGGHNMIDPSIFEALGGRAQPMNQGCSITTETIISDIYKITKETTRMGNMTREKTTTVNTITGEVSVKNREIRTSGAPTMVVFRM